MSDAESSYRAALERHGLADVQPLYRALLMRLKGADPAAYEDAVSRYQDEVALGIEREEVEPLEAWLGYGRWLAGRLTVGETVSIGPSGRSEPAGASAPLGTLLVHLPDDGKERAIVLAMPVKPSAAQRETVSLLCG